MITRRVVPFVVLALIFLFVGVAGAAAVFEYIPEPGSAPSIYDQFAWSSTSNGFWHVNANGATAEIKDSRLTLSGSDIELDRRVQTDPYATVVVAKVRGLSFRRFALGIGTYHAGTVGLEFDNEGIKCGYGSDYGWQIKFVKPWTVPPSGQWFYLKVDVINPYPNWTPQQLSKLNSDTMKRITLRCSAYDANHNLLGTVTAKDPPPNAHYVAFDEAYMRTWDSANRYQVDWFYTGPPAGNPAYWMR